MNVNDDLIREVYYNYIEALDKLLEILKISGALDNGTFSDWTEPLYNLIYKYTNND
jgi:hypothetical protein